MSPQKRYYFWVIIFLMVTVGSVINTPARAQQYWANMPPYNLLWPLWSPPLSPLDPLTKVPTPLVTWLDKDTILPVQPALIWDNVAFPKGPPWLLYNIPATAGGGMVYWDLIYGINPFPPSYLLTPSGFPIPNILESDFSYLLPTKTKHFASWVQVANLLYATIYGVPFTGLIGAADIWGLPPL
ncbi:MAG: hypothetical protein ACMUJM_19865 [bacterium]